MAQQFHAELAGEPHSWLEYAGAPYFSDTSFYAVTQLLQQFFAWRPEDSDEVRAAALARALEAGGLDPKTALPLMAPLLDVPVPAGGHRLRTRRNLTAPSFAAQPTDLTRSVIPVAALQGTDYAPRDPTA